MIETTQSQFVNVPKMLNFIKEVTNGNNRSQKSL